MPSEWFAEKEKKSFFFLLRLAFQGEGKWSCSHVCSSGGSNCNCDSGFDQFDSIGRLCNDRKGHCGQQHDEKDESRQVEKGKEESK